MKAQRIATIQEIKKIAEWTDFDLEDIEYEKALDKPYKDCWELLSMCNIGVDEHGEFYLK